MVETLATAPRIVNEPVWIDESRYEAELSAFIESARQSPHVLAIWTMGSVGAPGLSDLDAIVLVSDDFPEDHGHYLSVAHRDRRIMCHGALVIPQRLWGDLPLLKWTSNLTLRWARDPSIAESAIVTEPDFIFNATLYDNRISRRLQWELSRATNTIDARAWTRGLWSLTHAVSSCEKLGIELPPSFNATMADIHRFRQEWNETRRWNETAFLPLFERFGEMNGLVFEIAARESYRLLGGDRLPAPPKSVELHNRRYRFAGDDAPIGVEVLEFQIGSKRRTYFEMTLPNAAAHQLLTYLGEPTASDTPYATYLRGRQRAVRAHSAFMSTAGRHTKGARLRTSVPVEGIRSRWSRLADTLFWKAH